MNVPLSRHGTRVRIILLSAHTYCHSQTSWVNLLTGKKSTLVAGLVSLFHSRSSTDIQILLWFSHHSCDSRQLAWLSLSHPLTLCLTPFSSCLLQLLSWEAQVATPSLSRRQILDLLQAHYSSLLQARSTSSRQ